MVANSIFVNDVVQILPNPCSLTIKPRLEYSAFLIASLTDKLEKAYSQVRADNCQYYQENSESTNDNPRFKKQVDAEMGLVSALEVAKIVQKRLRTVSHMSNIAQTVSPLVLLVRTVNSNLCLSLPQIGHDLIELSGLLGSIVMDSGSLAEAKFDFKQTNLESRQILAEVNLIVESKIRTSYPNLNT